MLLAIPYTASLLLKYKNSDDMLRILACQRKVTTTILAKEAKVATTTARSLLKSLESVGCVKRQGRFFTATEAMGKDVMVINVRDRDCDALFRYSLTREVLFRLIARKHRNFAEMARALQTSYATLRDVIKVLKENGIIEGRSIRRGLLTTASDPIQLIPKANHRPALKHFIQALETYRPGFEEPIVVFGDISWGKASPSIDILGLSEAGVTPEELYVFVRALANAASVVTGTFGATINLNVSTKDAWLLQKLGAVLNPSPMLAEAYDGICIHGKLPSEADLFELMNKAYPLAKEKVEEWLRKGYVKRDETGRCTFTMKGLGMWRKNPAETFEEWLAFEGKNIRLIGIRLPSKDGLKL